MFLALGTFIHVVFLFSIFDIYFKSPIVNGITPYNLNLQTNTSRLVLIVTDGLRAESFLRDDSAPYLKYVATTRGSWGISNTRVPTESRPGHVALIAGFYEDPSAVARGWKKNPVDFDSVFNQSRFTWSWGAEDILHIFSQGTNNGHIYTYAYSTDNQDFGSNDTTLLDKWVFDKVKQFLLSAKKNAKLRKQLNGVQIILFLHLLGLDTSGHTHKPNSEKFKRNLQYVDNNIEIIEKEIEDFYENDGKTTYLVTSDHGMTDWGSHGASDAHETETPFIIWGASVAHQNVDDNIFSSTKRIDINQADIAPLMSTIIGVPVPVNSIGILPDSILNLTAENRARAIYSNARQLISQYSRKRELVESSALTFLYYPYEPLTEEKVDEMIIFTEKMLTDKNYDRLIILSKEMMELSLAGLNYYYNYYQNYLLLCMTLSFVGWILWLLTMLLEQKSSTQTSMQPLVMHKSSIGNIQSMFKNRNMNLCFGIICFCTIFLISAQDLPLQFYVYSLLPIVLWWRVLASANTWFKRFSDLKKQQSFYNLAMQIIAYAVGVETMVASFTHRWTLSIPLLGLALWPVLSHTTHLLSFWLTFTWVTTCVVLGIFSYLPVVGKDEEIALVLFASFTWILVYVNITYNKSRHLQIPEKEGSNENFINVIQLISLMAATGIVFVVSQNYFPDAILLQAASWIVAVIALVLPLTSSKRILCRLFAINFGLVTFYLMLSVNHEGVFMVTLCVNLYCWLLIEMRMSQPNNSQISEFSFGDNLSKNETKQLHNISKLERGLSSNDFRRSFLFLLYIMVSFFGTGNVASINSFEVRWVRCFITKFHPFVIAPLILCKTLAPFLSVACTFKAINTIVKAPVGYLITIVLIFSDLMALHFLYLVKNTGSWLEIGTSISHYVIIQTIILFMSLLYSLASVITEYTIPQKLFQIILPKRKKLL